MGKGRHGNQTTELSPLIDRLAKGDLSARDELLAAACNRLRLMASRKLSRFPGVHRFEDTDDVLQNACIRLHRALASTQPTSAKGFFGLAATQIRRELIDLYRHYEGPQGAARNEFAASCPSNDTGFWAVDDKADSTSGPSTLAEWTELHQQIGKLPSPEREVLEQIYYGGASKEMVAHNLGLSYDKVKRIWVSARLLLRKRLHNEKPGKEK